ncbi:iron-sulfur cluster carrier protein ApbC [Alteromonas sp. ASW11-19]|uniref:Iron-sulfur cluster carrier protein n=1 Tax=Alteromonas salexigens TaxID=2982530 RepID=A0ABT2VRG7_9ALTE|nr:iron-sulfur cluster carrier protein ApbC [Alteromonas salexigens]MCU7555901.1 iron-sulfur cluster carrier protein ApbC [Alteromonas salexigens]
MFFSRKGDKITQAASQALADYFSLEPNETERWCKLEKDSLAITLPFCATSQHLTIAHYVEDALQASGHRVDVTVTQHIQSAHTKQPPIRNIKNIIAVASGKGGVGKSTTAVNLALALRQEGARVGILDADIYGPSIPIMLGNPDASPSSSDNKHMQPLEAYGIVANSIGYLVPQEDAAVWRGPMASRALKQLLDETLWPVLDYLIVDMPPGTGDIQLTMAQQVPLCGAVVVTTPQDLAVADAQKGITMFNKVNVPVLGLIENMSYYECTACGHKDTIFSEAGGEALADRYGLPLLAALPLATRLRAYADSGEPLVSAQPDDPLTNTFCEAARALSMQLALSQPATENEQHVKGDPISFKPV